jgi:hypothetical protein
MLPTGRPSGTRRMCINQTFLPTGCPSGTWLHQFGVTIGRLTIVNATHRASLRDAVDVYQPNVSTHRMSLRDMVALIRCDDRLVNNRKCYLPGVPPGRGGCVAPKRIYPSIVPQGRPVGKESLNVYICSIGSS